MSVATALRARASLAVPRTLLAALRSAGRGTLVTAAAVGGGALPPPPGPQPRGGSPDAQLASRPARRQGQQQPGRDGPAGPAALRARSLATAAPPALEEGVVFGAKVVRHLLVFWGLGLVSLLGCGSSLWLDCNTPGASPCSSAP